MSGTDLTTAFAAAVARMERNRNAVALGTAPAERPVVELATCPDTGDVMLPSVPYLPVPCDDLAPALSVARAAGTQAGGVVASMSARRAARHYADSIERLLQPVADHDLIREWLARWAPRCRRQNGDDYDAFERAILLGSKDTSAVVFNDETAMLALQTPRFEWLPAPQAVFALLNAWIAPFASTLDAARKVAAGNDPEPPAREATESRPPTEAEIEARRAAVAKTMAKHKAIMDASREERFCGSKPKPTATKYSAYQHAVSLRNALASGGSEDKHHRAMTTRLAGLLRTHAAVSEELRLTANDVEAGVLDGHTVFA